MNVFDEIYATNLWGFGSGHGSLPAATKDYRHFLKEFLTNNNIQSVVDYGCGDWQFSKLINWEGIEYTGIETVRSLVKENNKRYGNKKIKFLLSPKYNNQIPTAELLIVKDVLQHLHTDAVKKFIKEVVPKYKFTLLINNMLPEDIRNVSIETGGFRPLDLREPPFSLEGTVIFTFGRHRRTYSYRHRKSFDPWVESVLLVRGRSKSGTGKKV